MPELIAEDPVPRVDAHYAELRDEVAAASAELIAAGLGRTPGNEIRGLAAAGHPLAMRYVQALDAFQDVAYERPAPSSGRASMKTIWREIFDFASGPARRAKRAARRPSALPALSPRAEALPG